MVNLPMIVKGVCPHDCPDTCSFDTQVVDGVAVELRGSHEHPVTQGFLCAKVNRYLERTYHSERLLTPMRRVGAKGEGRFEPATWDEAIADISARLLDVVAAHGPESVVPYSYSGTLGQVQGGGTADRFFHRLGASLLERTICAAAGSTAWAHTYGARIAPPIQDIAHSRLILLWGTNTLTSNSHLWPFIMQARERGARVVCIDPILTRTARAADEHISIRPGTDAALALAMMNVIFTRGLEDAQFLTDRTLGHEGLRAKAAEWDLDRASEVTGIPGETIERFAIDYATTRPAFIRLNYGLQRHYGGGSAVRAISLLPAVTGSWRDIGGGACLSTSGNWVLDSNFTRGSWVPAGTRSVNMVAIGDALTQDESIKALVVWNSNPAAVAPDLNTVRAGLTRPDIFTVVIEHFQTDTADYADWLLPATTQLEHWDLHKAYGNHYLSLNTPAIAPEGESLSNNEIFRRLARAMGMTDPEFEESDLELVKSLVSDEQFDELSQIGWIEGDVSQTPFVEGPILTPSGRIEIESQALARLGLDLFPTYVAPAELDDVNYPLTLLSPPDHGFLNSTFVNVPALARKAGEVSVLICAEDAAVRGLKEGDLARVFNDRGSFEARVHVTDMVASGVAASYGIRWARNSPGRRTVNDTTSQRLTDMGRGASFYDNAVEIVAVG
ncbi:MAG: molybdopterin oxidoreductase family protein [Actinobacteria bacterium]|nr:molybdopterin oxidoreductase family protein [Actinomycetota bacterium]